jgi:hypothetical protein
MTILACAPVAAQTRVWQQLTLPTYREAARGFETPPPEYAMTMWWFWNGPMNEADILRDLGEMRGHGIRSVTIWAYYGLGIEYLSPVWFERVRFAVEQAKRLDMRVWLMDEGSYPSGFAGGQISRLYPEARMKALVSPDPAGWEYRTSPTRYVHTPGFRKDATYSFLDPLDAAATRIFLSAVHEQYKNHVGGEFGKTVMGFMGDEPSVAGLPWTAALPEEFQRRKGYDLRPRLAALFAAHPDETARRVRADYYDVWTGLYSRNFFQPQTEWCGREGLEYIVHLCGEEDLQTLIQLDGDYFRCNRTVQMPGVDAIWRQIWPGVTADYPKLASSSAHLRGRSRAFTESYAVYGQGLSLEQAKWVMDHQFARGINHFQAMEFLSSNAEFRQYFHPPNWRGSPQWPMFSQLAAYANRTSYALSIGRPAAGIALYYPTTSAWLGDQEAERSVLALARALLEIQRDFDFVDEEGLTRDSVVRDGALWNRSGQAYRAVLVPSVAAMSQAALAQLEAFARAGGQVLWMGRLPSLVPGKTYLNAAPASANLLRSGAQVLVEPSGRLTAAVLERLPEPDAVLSPAAPSVKYLHRRWKDAEIYFFFNESDTALRLEARLQGTGDPELWEPLTGVRTVLAGSKEASHVRLTLALDPFGSALVVLSPEPHRPASPPPVLVPHIAIEGDWTLTFDGQNRNAPLRSWAELGRPDYWGTATYRKEFSLGAALPRRLWLDLGTVNYAARARLNGQDLGVRAWRPFRWEISRAARRGANVLEVEVTNTRANELAGDPARYREIEARGWLQGSYINTYLKFDREMVPSGLLGPGRILRADEAGHEGGRN